MSPRVRLEITASRVLIAGIALSLVSGILQAWTTADRSAFTVTVIGMSLIGVSILLGVPSLVSGMWSLAKGGGRRALGRTFWFLGPLAVFVGMELIPHALNPCIVTSLLGKNPPGICETIVHRGGFQGKGELMTSTDINDQWHQLHHALIGGVPLALLYRRGVRRRTKG